MSLVRILQGHSSQTMTSQTFPTGCRTISATAIANTVELDQDVSI